MGIISIKKAPILFPFSASFILFGFKFYLIAHNGFEIDAGRVFSMTARIKNLKPNL